MGFSSVGLALLSVGSLLVMIGCSLLVYLLEGRSKKHAYEAGKCPEGRFWLTLGDSGRLLSATEENSFFCEFALFATRHGERAGARGENPLSRNPSS